MKHQQGEQEALAHELFTAAQLAPGEGIEDAVGRLAALVEAQQSEVASSSIFDGVIPAAIRRYLRKCSSGGMSKKHIDIVQINVDEAERLDYFKLAIAEAVIASRVAAPQPAPVAPAVQQAVSQPAKVWDYPPMPDFDTVEQHIYGACRRYITQDMLEPIHNLIRDAIDADRAARAPADSMTAPASGEVAGWLPVHSNGHKFYGAPLKTEAEAKQYINQVHQSSDSVTLIVRPFTWIATPPTQATSSVTTPAGERENLALRRMLCVAHAGAEAYMDDGETQDSRELPVIDFLRDTPAEIQDKLQKRMLNKLTDDTTRVPVDATRLFFDAGWKACANFCDRDDVRFDGIVGQHGCPQFEEAFRAARKQGGV